jgi:hypothetical protein
LQKLFEAFPSIVHLFVGHFEEVGFFWELGEGVVADFEVFDEGIKLGEPFVNEPFIIFALDFDGEEDSILLDLALLILRDGDPDGRDQVVVVH